MKITFSPAFGGYIHGNSFKRSIGGLALLWVATCTSATDARGSAATPAQLPKARITFVSNTAEVTVAAEVAEAPDDVQRGLMYRRKLASHHGMLFVFKEDSVQRFWMKNTYIPLDMIFVGNDHKVVGVVEHAEPLTLDSRGVDRPSRYVVEVNAGFAAQYGIKAGTAVTIVR